MPTCFLASLTTASRFLDTELASTSVVVAAVTVVTVAMPVKNSDINVTNLIKLCLCPKTNLFLLLKISFYFAEHNLLISLNLYLTIYIVLTKCYTFMSNELQNVKIFFKNTVQPVVIFKRLTNYLR